MNQDKYVFAQLISFLNRTQFNNYVRKYDGNNYVKHFTCWNQLLAMMFGQLSNRESLRDLIVAFEAHRSKQYHLGLGRKPIAKTTLASANQNRDMQLFDGRVMYIYIMGKGWDTEQRSIEIVKTSASELCQVFNCPALLTQCKRIQGTWNGLK